MKRVLSFFLLICFSLQMIGVSAAGNTRYEYILPIGYYNIYVNEFTEIITAMDKETEKYAVYDFNGNKLSGDYDDIVCFKSGQMCAERDGITYVIDRSGAVEYQFDGYVFSYCEPYVFVDLSGNNDGRPLRFFEGEFAVCDLAGEQLAVFPYSKTVAAHKPWGVNFYGDMLLFCENEKWGAMNERFEPTVEPLYDELYPFNTYGVAIARIGDKYGVVNLIGEVTADFIYDEIIWDNLFDAESCKGYVYRIGDRYGILNRWGERVTEPFLDSIPNTFYPNEELIVVYKENTREDKETYSHLYGLVDFEGNTVLETEYTYISVSPVVVFGEGIINAEKTSNMRGYYDLSGNEITDFNYRMTTDFSEGVAFAARCRSDNTEWVYEVIDKNGNVLFETDSFSQGFEDGYACLGSKKVIDKCGKVVLDLSGELDAYAVSYPITYAGRGIFKVTDGECVGLIRLNDEPLWDYEYIDFGNVDIFFKYDNGYKFELTDGTEIYLDKYGNVTEDIESVMAQAEKEDELPEIPKWITGEYEYLGEDVFLYDNKLIKSDGKVIAENWYHITEMGDNGYIGISLDDFEGYINADGEKVLALANGYYVQGSFSEGLAPVVRNEVYSRLGEVSYINEQGEIMLTSKDEQWYSGGAFENGLFVVGIRLGKGGPKGRLLVKCVYDTPSDWAEEIVEKAKNYGLLPEELAESYRRNITRERFCELAYELPIVKEMKAEEDATFSDTSNPKINHLASLGIIKGVGNDRFAPKSLLTREEAATILSRILEISGAEIPKPEYTENTALYNDGADISEWAVSSVFVMRETGIMQGVGDNKFAPKDNYTTEQAIATVLRLYEDI